MSTLEKLYKNIAYVIEQEQNRGEQMFMGKPDRWYENPKFRCVNNHVSNMILKSEIEGDCCLVCYSSCVLTFPEDKDGPLEIEVDSHIILGYN